MPRRASPIVAGRYYHIYNRGNNRQPIFFERENYLFFLRRLRRYLVGEPKTSEVIAYCLMPNHFHLLVSPHDDCLSRRMQRFSISYTKAINNRYGRVGALFQGQFQALPADQDGHLLHLSRYIHLNPVAAGLVERGEDWEFSSYQDYLGLRSGTLPSPDIVLSQFAEPSAYRAFVEAYHTGDQRVIAHLLLDDKTQV
jgi:putative transposase